MPTTFSPSDCCCRRRTLAIAPPVAALVHWRGPGWQRWQRWHLSENAPHCTIRGSPTWEPFKMPSMLPHQTTTSSAFSTPTRHSLTACHPHVIGVPLEIRISEEVCVLTVQTPSTPRAFHGRCSAIILSAITDDQNQIHQTDTGTHLPHPTDPWHAFPCHKM